MLVAAAAGHAPDAVAQQAKDAAITADPAPETAGASGTPAAPSNPPTLQQAIGNPDDFTLSASVRARVESLDNDFRSTANPSDTILSLRTTLAAEYHPGILRIGGELMDSRIYFDNRKTPVTVNDVNAMELIQAYVGLDLGHVLGKGSDTSVQAGRFTMEFGARRMIARNNFRNDTNAYTGIRVDVKAADKTKITAFYTLPLTRLPRAQTRSEPEGDRGS